MIFGNQRKMEMEKEVQHQSGMQMTSMTVNMKEMRMISLTMKRRRNMNYKKNLQHLEMIVEVKEEFKKRQLEKVKILMTTRQKKNLSQLLLQQETPLITRVEVLEILMLIHPLSLFLRKMQLPGRRIDRSNNKMLNH